ncbi:helix-turn-helix transcriptional regulator [Curtobacterium luteum]|uniref:helix-turn-helix transcriptional regulator n=1 Tax=Curtobacterium luteum TaxID=33881 RepID=UPI003819E072
MTTDSPTPPTDSSTVPARLRDARETLGYTQEDVARALGLSRTAVHAFEHGKRKVSVDEITKLSHLYGRSVNWLIGEEPHPDVSGTALFRAASELSPKDREQVLKFAQFLAASPRNLDT